MGDIAEPMRSRGKTVVERFAAGKFDEFTPHEFLLAAGKVIPLVRRVVAVFPHGRHARVAIGPKRARDEPERSHREHGDERFERCFPIFHYDLNSFRLVRRQATVRGKKIMHLVGLEPTDRKSVV